LVFNTLDLMPCRLALLLIQFQRSRAGQPPLCPIHDRDDRLQIADQFSACLSRGFLGDLPLRFEEQLGRIQNPFADCRRSFAPGRIEKTCVPCIAPMLDEDGGHLLAIFQALARHRHQKSQGHLCRHLALAHLLLDGFRQHLHQRQPTRHPAHAAIEPAG
jgi:hypothetical protein